MKQLRSYVQDGWVEGAADRSRLVNPTTEEVLAESSTYGIDFRAVLDHARERGGPALRGMTFAERGRMLAAAATAIHAHREELVELAIANGGNTRADAKFDIDGATATLSAYATLGESLGDARMLVDGEMTQLGRSPRLVGQHVRVSRTGVAVHINAFNFPAWGMAEKAAVAWLAGVPVVTKPATSTALVAARIVEILIDATVLPEGALSFLAGGVGDLLEHLESQDVLAFTGSGVTGAILRGGRRAIERSVRINVEADSLNAAVLGPDVDVDGDTYELFIREVARDITQKAGQKCTAIRRVFAPRELYERVREDLAARVGEVRVGDPALAEVKMGPLATARQLADVREGVDRLKKTAKVYFGGGRGSLVGVEGDRGFFMAPVLLASEDAAAAVESHCHEVFGPVATVMAYSGAADEASRLVNLGDGGLVSSVYSDDPVFIGEMLTGIAPYHGRLNVGSAKVAEHSMGPGTVLASLVHGGPGRAGGGEELGGLRGLAFYMQRVAVQGYRPMLERIWGAAGLLPL